MTNTELIKALRYCAEHEGCDYYIAKDCPIESTWVCGADCEQILMLAAADALEAADERIEQLEKQEPTEKQVVDYCHKRCLVIVEEELFHRMKSTFSQLPKEGEWIMLDTKNFIEMCSRCRYTAYTVNRPNYCPNCGAKMRTVTDCHTLDERRTV